jgi:hypothetical protein
MFFSFFRIRPCLIPAVPSNQIPTSNFISSFSPHVRQTLVWDLVNFSDHTHLFPPCQRRDRVTRWPWCRPRNLEVKWWVVIWPKFTNRVNTSQVRIKLPRDVNEIAANCELETIFRTGIFLFSFF